MECTSEGIWQTFWYLLAQSYFIILNLTFCFVGEESEEDEEELNGKCSDLKPPTRKKRFREPVDVKYDSEDDGEEIEDVQNVAEAVPGLRGFRPLYLLSEWNQPETTTKRISVANCATKRY